RSSDLLEKAKAERATAGVAEHGEVAASGEASGPTLEADIQYSQTKVVELDARVLRKNNVIYGANDRAGLTAYKMLRTQVLQRMVAQNWNALAISSPSEGDGKTLTSINLAISLARELHHTVLLVDLDLRNPCVSKYFGFAPERGIDDYLVHGYPLESILVNPGIERLVVLPARQAIENSSELLASPAMGRLVQELKTRYPSRFVLFDVPPVLASDDALAFAPHIDALLLVLRDAKSTRQELDHALHILEHITVLGTVLNASSEKISTYY
ncbi:MAG: CpsD/CapB family tyrosine-protein kinase, partial [Woeseia sp.]